MTSPTPPGWFPDPLRRYEHRWFNGRDWTADVAANGQRFVDPLGISPGPTTVGDPGRRGNGLATASMTCGIIAVLVAWAPFIVVIGIVLAVLAIVFGVRGLSRSRTVGSGRGLAIAGLVTGGVAMLLAVLGIALSVLFYRAIDDFIHPGPVATEVIECRVDGADVAAHGTLTNRSRDERGYTLFVTTRVRPGGDSTGVERRDEVVTVADVAAGATIEWQAATTTRFDDGVCAAEVDVAGPFPFGVEVDRVDTSAPADRSEDRADDRARVAASP